MKPFNFLLLLIAIAGFNCSNQGMDRQTKMKYDMYMTAGKGLYETHCANCHQLDGNGFARLYPPLNKSDYLMQNLPLAACIVKYGQQEKIIVNGIEYEMQMVGVPTLSNLEIAEILTYVTNSWENEGGFVSVKEVERWMSNCQ